MLKTWANSLAEGNPVWAVPAGVSRGQVPSVTGTKYNVGQAVLAEWQSDYDEFNANVLENYKVNPIMKLRQYGYVINGNATLLKTQNGARSLTDQLSVRVIANLIKSQAYDYALGLQFGQMSDDLFAKFKTLLDTYLGQLVYQGALYDYKITMNTSMISTSLNTRTIPVLIQISPVPAVENFDITLEISRAGVVFTDNE
jgi:phage tail sheath protein FI